MFGGERRGNWMSELTGNERKLPLSIDFLYNNNLLDMFNMLCVLYEFRQRKSGVSVDELTFYLSIATSDNFEHILKFFEQGNEDIYSSVESNYYYYEPKIRLLILKASNLELISFIPTKKKIDYNFKMKISSIGIEKIENLENVFFKYLISRMEKIKLQVKYNKSNLSILQGGIL